MGGPRAGAGWATAGRAGYRLGAGRAGAQARQRPQAPAPRPVSHRLR